MTRTDLILTCSCDSSSSDVFSHIFSPRLVTGGTGFCCRRDTALAVLGSLSCTPLSPQRTRCTLTNSHGGSQAGALETISGPCAGQLPSYMDVDAAARNWQCRVGVCVVAVESPSGELGPALERGQYQEDGATVSISLNGCRLLLITHAWKCPEVNLGNQTASFAIFHLSSNNRRGREKSSRNSSMCNAWPLSQVSLAGVLGEIIWKMTAQVMATCSSAFGSASSMSDHAEGVSGEQTLNREACFLSLDARLCSSVCNTVLPVVLCWDVCHRCC